jgi:alpha-D-ribose 1-methylphosphonate 5-triphosphate synthase subunit PhnI
MGYAAARGGVEAILAAEELVRRKRVEGSSPKLEIGQIMERLGLAVDRVVGEGGLWAPELAAFALRQTEGDIIEAVQLLRSYRSTLPRVAHAVVVDMNELEILRRIVPAYRTPPGPQLLGKTLDYVGRMLDTDEPDRTDVADATDDAAHTAAVGANGTTGVGEDDRPLDRHPGRLLHLLASMDLLVEHRRTDDPDPFDITTQPVRPGVPRSAVLSVMARAETGALVNLWYRNVLGPDGYIHEITLGEVRHGRIPVRVLHPHTERPVTIGTVRVSEVEGIEDLNGPDEQRDRFDIGYGLCLGHNERKVIAMANLDIAVRRDKGASMLEQSVVMTTDGLDSSGFLEHLKLPHYVTFRSMVERKQAVRSATVAAAEPGRRANASEAEASRAPAGGDCTEVQAGGPALPLGAAK